MTQAYTPAPQPPATDSRTTMVSNMLGIAGIVILVIIAIWGLLHLATLTGGWLGSFSPKKASSIIVTAPKDAYSGTPMTLSWKYVPSEKGTYALLYSCANGLRLALPTSDNGFVPLPCGAAFTLGNATSSMPILPLYTGTSTVNETVTVLYIPSATTTKTTAAQGTATIAVHPGAIPPTSATSTPEKPKPSTKPTTKPTTRPTVSGPADLAVSMVSITADGYGNGVAVFDIANRGGSESGSYSFTAQVPTEPTYTYVSPIQAPLAPGSHIESTLRFTQAIPGLFSVSVTGDSTPGNDTAGQYLAVPYYGSY